MKHIIRISGMIPNDVLELKSVLLYENGLEIEKKEGGLIVYKTKHECVTALERGYTYLSKKGDLDSEDYAKGVCLSLRTAIACVSETLDFHAE